MLRTHDVVLADGTFRVVLTPKRRVIAAIDAPTTPLGPMHVAFEIDRSAHLPPHVSPEVLHDPRFVTAGLLGDIAGAVGSAAEGAFNATSKVATSIARPAFDVLKTATAEGAHLVAHLPVMPDVAKRQLESAAHVILRARLGDMNAKQFIRTIGAAAKAGVGSAMHIADSLVDASKFVAKTIDVPAAIASHVPGIGAVVHAISPFEKFQSMATALQRGDFNAIKKMAESELAVAQGMVSLVPGVGTGVSAAIGAGLAALEGGSPLEFAIRTAYGAIPIPIGVRQVTDTVVDTVLELARNPHNLSDAAIAVARDRVPSGLPRDVFDTLVRIVVHRVPIQKAGESLVSHYVRQYAGAGEHLNLGDVLAHALHPSNGRMIQPLHFAN